MIDRYAIVLLMLGAVISPPIVSSQVDERIADLRDGSDFRLIREHSVSNDAPDSDSFVWTVEGHRFEISTITDGDGSSAGFRSVTYSTVSQDLAGSIYWLRRSLDELYREGAIFIYRETVDSGLHGYTGVEESFEYPDGASIRIRRTIDYAAGLRSVSVSYSESSRGSPRNWDEVDWFQALPSALPIQAYDWSAERLSWRGGNLFVDFGALVELGSDARNGAFPYTIRTLQSMESVRIDVPTTDGASIVYVSTHPDGMGMRGVEIIEDGRTTATIGPFLEPALVLFDVVSDGTRVDSVSFNTIPNVENASH